MDANGLVSGKCEHAAPVVRAFVAAHLLTGSIRRAEEVTLEAFDAWNPLEEPEAALFERLTSLAARTRKYESSSDLTSEPGLPKELNAVLKLAPRLRLCFVTRVLVGLAAPTCARALGIPLEQIDEYAGAAARSLALAARPADS